MWTPVTDRVVAIAPSNGPALMVPCGDATDSYCCSPDGKQCSCENGNVTLAVSISATSSINFIPLVVPTAASGSEAVQSSSTSSTWTREKFLKRR